MRPSRVRLAARALGATRSPTAEPTTNQPTNRRRTNRRIEHRPRREGLAPSRYRPRNDVTITTAFTTHDPPRGLRRSPADPTRTHLAIHRDTGGAPRCCPRHRVVSAGRRVRAGNPRWRGRRRSPPTSASCDPRPDGSGPGSARRPGAFRDRAAIAPADAPPRRSRPVEPPGTLGRTDRPSRPSSLIYHHR